MHVSLDLRAFRRLFLCTWGLFALGASISQATPLGLFLTWVDDPLRSMVIDWHTPQTDSAGTLEYREKGTRNPWQAVQAERIAFPSAERTIHRASLENLRPGTTYEFRMDGERPTYRFRTMPADSTEPITVAIGGDTRHRKEWMDAMNRRVMDYDLDLIIWGGDLAYADGKPENVGHWFEWFDSIKETLITRDRRVIPIIVGIGNHEVQGGFIHGGGRRPGDYEQTDAFRASIAPYFYKLFAFPGQPGYAALDFGNYLSLIILDSEHSNPIEGTQTEWLNETLAHRARQFRHIIPIYHMPAYPSHRAFDARPNRLVREHWVPLFEQYGVRFAFENHDHAYKRTRPLRNNTASDDGIIYFGDGAWGVGTRSVKPAREYGYMAKTASVRHAIIMTLQGSHLGFQVIAEDGTTIDRFPQPAPPAHIEPSSPHKTSSTPPHRTPRANPRRP